MQWRPFVTVAAIAEREGRFLVVEETSDSGIVFNQPAGHLEEGETLPDAVRREVLEETGWTFEPRAVVGIYLYAQPGTDVTYLRVCFSGDCVVHDEGRPLDHGILRAAWLTRAELAAQGDARLRSPLVLRCIDDFLAGKSHSLELLDRVAAGPGR